MKTISSQTSSPQNRRPKLYDMRYSISRTRAHRRWHRLVRCRFRQNQRQTTSETVWHHEIPRPHLFQVSVICPSMTHPDDQMFSNVKKWLPKPHREKEPIIYEGDLMDEAGVLDFLTSLEAMDLPDRIEEVNAKILSKIIEDSDYVAVLFCKLAITCWTMQPSVYTCLSAQASQESCTFQTGNHLSHFLTISLMYIEV